MENLKKYSFFLFGTHIGRLLFAGIITVVFGAIAGHSKVEQPLFTYIMYFGLLIFVAYFLVMMYWMLRNAFWADEYGDKSLKTFVHFLCTGWHTYSIPAGKHYARGRFPDYYNKSQLNFLVKFSKECLATLHTSDDADINKLYGVNFGISKNAPHDNSIRIGWRPEGETIILYAYHYCKGIRFSRRLTMIATPEKEIKINLKFARQYNMYYIYIDGVMFRFDYDFTNCPSEEFILFPYYGGTSISPVDMKIYIKKLK